MKYPEKFYFKKLVLLGNNSLYISYEDWDHAPTYEDIAEQEKSLDKHGESLVKLIETAKAEGTRIISLDKKFITPNDFLKHMSGNSLAKNN